MAAITNATDGLTTSNQVPTSPANAPIIDPDTGALDFPSGQSVSNMTGMVHCGYNGVHRSCMSDHLSIRRRGSVSRLIRKEMGKRRFAEATESSSNMRTERCQYRVARQAILLSSFSRCSYYIGYSNIGGAAQGGGPLIYPLTITSINNRDAMASYVRQYHLDIQRELARNTLLTVAYVGSKGTHLSRQLDGNQIHSTPPVRTHFCRGKSSPAQTVTMYRTAITTSTMELQSPVRL